jgi:hypothetical protein
MLATDQDGGNACRARDFFEPARPSAEFATESLEDRSAAFDGQETRA